MEQSKDLLKKIEEVRMKLSVTLKTSDYRGDHATDISVSYEYVEGETVEDLVKRCMPEGVSHVDWIEIRAVRENIKLPEDITF